MQTERKKENAVPNRKMNESTIGSTLLTYVLQQKEKVAVKHTKRKHGKTFARPIFIWVIVRSTCSIQETILIYQLIS